MLNRPATKIDLCLEEELIEYDDVKILRQENNIFQTEQENKINKPLLSIKDIDLEKTPQIYEDVFIDKSSFYYNNDHSNKKEFNLNNVIFNSESSLKHEPFKIDNESQFKTPENK